MNAKETAQRLGKYWFLSKDDLINAIADEIRAAFHDGQEKMRVRCLEEGYDTLRVAQTDDEREILLWGLTGYINRIRALIAEEEVR